MPDDKINHREMCSPCPRGRIDSSRCRRLYPSAPDAAAASGTYDKGLAKGKMRQIAIAIAPVLLRRVDETAARTGQARAAIISMAIWRALAGDVFQWQIICEALSFNVQRKYKRDE